jgi:uncharacterized protein
MPELSIENGINTNGNRDLAPITVKERLPIIDILRGFAILGILLLNMREYSFPHGFNTIYLEMFPGMINKIVYWGSVFFFQSKLATMLSILLGLGMAVQVARAQEKGKPFTGFYARRMFFLLLIGVVHDLVLFPGLILPIFSVMGFFLLFFQKRSRKTVFTWFIIFSLLPIMITAVRYGIRRAAAPPPANTQIVQNHDKTSSSTQQDVKKQREEKRRQKRWDRCNETIDTFRNGNYFDMVRHRFDVLRKQTVPIIIFWGWATLGLFLLGVWIWQKGILQDIEGHLKFLRRTLWLSLAVGLVSTSIASLMRFVLTLPSNLFFTIITLLSRIAGATALCLFFMSAVVLLTRKEKWKRFLMPLAAVGRLAFSNYVFQTLLCTTLFSSYGFKMFGKTGPVVNLLLIFIVWAIQVPLSVWWSRRFRFGPVEWLWRSLTYGKRQPMRLEPK